LGANSYLTKNSDSELIYEAIKTCHEQEFFFNAHCHQLLLHALQGKVNKFYSSVVLILQLIQNVTIENENRHNGHAAF